MHLLEKDNIFSIKTIYQQFTSVLLLLLMLVLFPVTTYAGDGVYWLKTTQGDPFTNRNSAGGKVVLQLMQDNTAVDGNTLKLLEAGWWCQIFGPRRPNVQQPLPKYFKLPMGTKLELTSPSNCRAMVLLRFEKDGRIYTVQQNTFVRGNGGDEKAFQAKPGDKAPQGPYFTDPKVRMPNNGGINGAYEGLVPGSKVIRGYDEELILENQVKTNEKNLFTYTPNEMERLSLNADNRLYSRHLVVMEKLKDKEYISTLSTTGMRSRRKFLERGQGIMLAVASGLLCGAGCMYMIRRRSKHVNS